MNKILKIVFILFVFNFGVLQAQNFSEFTPIKINFGDSLNWKNTDYNDTSWQYLFDKEFYTDTNFVWIRTKAIIDTSVFQDSILFLVVDMAADYEVYWNGRFIGKNYEGSSLENSRKGMFDKYYILKKNEIHSENSLAIRAKIYDGYFYLETLNIETKDTYFHSNFYLYGYIAIIIVVNLIILYLTFTYFKNLLSTQLKALIATVIFISISAYVLEFINFMGWLSYDIMSISFFLYDIFEYFLLLGIVIHSAEFFDIHQHKELITTLGIFLLLTYLMETDFVVPLIVTLTATFMISFVKIKTHRFESYVSLIFVFVISLLLMSPLKLMLADLGFYLLIYFLVSIFMKEENKNRIKLAEMRIQKSILESHLLKKIIQPHYLMNSLNAMVGLFEESIDEGLKFLNEITDEFRMFLNISDKKSITIREELKLCQHHLSVMQYRKERTYLLENKITQINKKIPPAIFQTIIENGITHEHNCKEGLQFILTEDLLYDRTVYKIISKCIKCKIKDYEELKNGFDKSKINEGTGLHYVRSRLRESYGNSWELDYYGNNKVWVTEIIIYNGALK